MKEKIWADRESLRSQPFNLDMITSNRYAKNVITDDNLLLLTAA